MVTEFRLPELGEDIETGDVISVLVSQGDNVEEEQALMEIETDKATIEVPAPVSGVIKEIHVKEGSRVKVGELLVTFDEADGASKGGEEETRSEDGEKGREESKAQKKEVKEAEKQEKKDKKKQGKAKGEEDEKAEGEEPKEDKAETKKVEKEKKKAEADEGGKEEKAEAKEKEGQVVEFGRRTKTGEKEQAPQGPVPASPSVRRLARELGVEIEQVPGSGPGGRISEDDVKNYTRWIVVRGTNVEGDTLPSPVSPVTPAPLPDFTQWGKVERKAMSNVRRKTAEVMTSSWLTIPHVTQHDMADITHLEELRKEFGKNVEKAGGKLTVTAILLKVVAAALKRFPQCNASVDMSTQEVIYKKYYNIGVAVDTERGLYVPVIRDVDKKDVLDISIELMDLAEKARSRKLSPEDMKGGTFTISNQGTIGGIYFSPIINWPEVAILGVSRSRIQAAYIDGKFEPRMMMPLSLSHDHRAIDGADAVRFLRWVVEALEQPFKLVLEG